MPPSDFGMPENVQTFTQQIKLK